MSTTTIVNYNPNKKSLKAGDIFGTTTCTRCGGDGRYSWNPMDGDRCFGCLGSGKQVNKKARAMATEYIEAVAQSQNTQVKNLVVGDMTHPFDNCLTGLNFTVTEVTDTTVTITRLSTGETMTQDRSTNLLMKRRFRLVNVLELLSVPTRIHVESYLEI